MNSEEVIQKRFDELKKVTQERWGNGDTNAVSGTQHISDGEIVPSEDYLDGMIF